jgi:hypothetical protein
MMTAKALFHHSESFGNFSGFKVAMQQWAVGSRGPVQLPDGKVHQKAQFCEVQTPGM